MRQTLKAPFLALALAGGLAAFAAAASADEGAADRKSGSGHGDRITWPCPEPHPTS